MRSRVEIPEKRDGGLRPKTSENLPRKGVLSLLFLSLLLTGGCISSPPPGLSVSEDGAETVPRRVYALDFNSAWSLVLEALEKNRIPMQIIQKKMGLMKTGYQKGQEMVLLRENFATRYKFVILDLSQDRQKTIVDIRCVYEIREKRGGAFAEATTVVPQEVRLLENKMYRLIESYLRPHERR
jgi:hypothetical protein